ncbi:hypothetical protein GOP47_0013790, partial [Adiantum capillus-veneris]
PSSMRNCRHSTTVPTTYWCSTPSPALPDYHHYRIFLCRGYAYDVPGHLEIYDSRTASWRAGRSHTDARIGGARELEHADFLHFSYTHGTVFVYNVELDEWSQFCGFFPCRAGLKSWSPTGTTLFKHRGRVMVASVQCPKRGMPPTGFAVWELHSRATDPPHTTSHDEVVEWVEVARTPPHLV